jgi:hypothetical protein
MDDTQRSIVYNSIIIYIPSSVCSKVPDLSSFEVTYPVEDGHGFMLRIADRDW